MAIHIHNGGKGELNKKESVVQYMPFKIHADCDADVSEYFTPLIKTEGEGELSASFRGYPLKGKRLEFPEGYRGVVLHERIKIDNDKEDRRLYVTHNFNTMTLWNWDKKPSANDAFQRAMDWIDIAEALHSPVMEE